jgi:hypothetical protein
LLNVADEPQQLTQTSSRGCFSRCSSTKVTELLEVNRIND